MKHPPWKAFLRVRPSMVMLEADTAMPPGRMLKVRPPPSSTAWAQPEVGRAARERARGPSPFETSYINFVD